MLRNKYEIVKNNPNFIIIFLDELELFFEEKVIFGEKYL
jgi:hypothetical protein